MLDSSPSPEQDLEPDFDPDLDWDPEQDALPSAPLYEPPQLAQRRSTRLRRERVTVVKLILLGDSGVGKTALLKRFCDDEFAQEHRATIGADVSTKEVFLPEVRSFARPEREAVTDADETPLSQALSPEDRDISPALTGASPSSYASDDSPNSAAIPQGRNLSLQLWDTGGQERYASIARTFYRGANACALVFDISQPASLERTDKWRSRIIEEVGPLPAVLIGNKTDLYLSDDEPLDVVSTRTAEAFAKERGMPFFACSALSGDGVEQAFMDLCALAVWRPAPRGSAQLPVPLGAVLREEAILEGSEPSDDDEENGYEERGRGGGKGRGRGRSRAQRRRRDEPVDVSRATSIDGDALKKPTSGYCYCTVA